MLQLLRETVVRPVVERWLINSDRSWRALESPDSSSVVSLAGPDPDRILLVGGGINAGWGENSHESALAGSLARHIVPTTGRGLRIDVVVDDILSGTGRLGSRVASLLRTIDAVVVTPGDLDALLLLSPALYRRQVERVLESITERAPAGAQIFVLGSVPLTSLIPLSPMLRWMTTWLAGTLDNEARHACTARTNAAFISLRPDSAPDREPVVTSYENWAGMIAPTISERLDSCSDTPIR